MAKTRKPKKKTLTWWKTKTWDDFSKYIRLRDAIYTTGTMDTLVCFTCDKEYPAFGKGCAQAGHFVTSRRHAVLFEKNGVHGQCYNCNINLKGNTVPYRDKMVERYGVEETERLEQGYYNHTFKYTVADLMELRESIQQDIKELKETFKKGI